ncbi:trihelix transcription factor GT-2-like [Heracleum sosnowskyi]|uniref:Trihelix transcription factor GT-2-like n=1 Tax=Heracleum sosnowskyi TaxID=360622 RepID=A0AAD8MF96_9APIA|nr:trihelix transcription factor GT-2-like [Heracleum sosnowskyi]
MMLQQQGGAGVPGLIGSSADSVAAAAETREPGGGGSGGSGGGMNEEDKGRSEESERNSGGSRWPRQETIALLKIRSDMDVAFRDSSLKGPLWDEVSRKLSELGYHRSAKKCKEKFENVYKYHKRTKDGRNTKNDGKTYRFFEQLEALDTHPSLSLMSWSPMKSQPPTSHQTTMLASATMPGNNNSIHMNTIITSSPVVTNVTVSSTPSPISTVFPSNAVHPINISSHHVSSQPTVTINPSIPSQKPIGLMNNHNPNMSFLSNSTSSTSSDEQPERYGKRKRKWEDFFGRLMTEVIQKQDELQQKFLDTLEKREKERIAREEAWRVQEMAKMNREHELLLQERSMSAAKDAAVISFLQKITEQQQQNSPNQTQVQAPVPAPQTQLPIVPPPRPPVQVSQPHPMPPTQAPAIVTPQAPTPAPAPSAPTPVKSTRDEINVQSSNYNGGSDNANFMSPSPSRWPKAEIQALINFRTTLDTKYHENGPKGPLWEEISSAMRKIGYNRNAKRCKEKWENINKYYKKVKESNKKRPEDAKTCPYFHQLEALYKEKAKTEVHNSNTNLSFNSNPVSAPMPIMVQPEQQWPLQETKQKNQNQDHEQDHESDNMDDHNMNEDDYEDDDEDDDDGGAFEIVTNKLQDQTRAE